MAVLTLGTCRQYELEHNKFLEEKIAEEKAKHAEVVAQAKKDLDNFYAERKQRSSKARAENMCVTVRTCSLSPSQTPHSTLSRPLHTPTSSLSQTHRRGIRNAHVPLCKFEG